MSPHPSATCDIQGRDGANHQERTDHSFVRRYRCGDEQPTSAIYQRDGARWHGLAKRRIACTVTRASEERPFGRGETLTRDRELFIREIVESLNPDDQQMVQLRLDGHKVADIAARTKRSKRTLECVLPTFRLQIQGVLQGD